MFNINAYKSIIFDCDGVILDSNKVKSNAFYECALPFGNAAAEQLLAFHIANGGVSRYEKFRYFLSDIVPETASKCSGNLDIFYNDLLKSYQDKVIAGLVNCKVAPGLNQLRTQTTRSTWCVVSGGDQSEVRDILRKKGLAQLFDGGIFGSPDSKTKILAREIQKQNIILPALFLGDSKYDYESSKISAVDFAFISGWSECSFLKEKVDIKRFKDISEIVKSMD